MQAQELTKMLKKTGTKVTLIRSENQRLAAGTLVAPSFLAKGLEFDAIIAGKSVPPTTIMKINGNCSTRFVQEQCIA